LTYHTVRSWIRDFRAQCRAGQIPPFSPHHSSGDRRADPWSSRHSRRNRPQPIVAK
jgi:hypothetical protein